jgi:predicted glycosyltransferase involved in capsule biosynthesis
LQFVQQKAKRGERVRRDFFLQFCDVAEVRSVDDLVRFGYIIVGKKIRILIYTWLPTYHKNLANWIYFSLKSGEFGPISP